MGEIVKYIIESYIIHSMLITKYDEERIEDKNKTLTKYCRIDYPALSDCVKVKRTHTLKNY